MKVNKNAHMSEQAPSGWYPDKDGIERFWDGSRWSDQVRPVSGAPSASKTPGTFAKFGSAVKARQAEKKSAKDETNRLNSEKAQAAGALVTSGVFGTSTIEIYAGGFVRVASWPTNGPGNATVPRRIDKKTPYERLRSIKYTGPDEESTGTSSALEGAVGPAVATLLKGGKGLMKASAPGMAMAGISHVASNAKRKAYLTIATDLQIHTLDNQVTNSLGLKTSNKGHNEVGLALQDAGNSLLGIASQPPAGDSAPRHQALPTQDAAGSSSDRGVVPVGARLRELADLHQEGVLSDEEFAAAKARLLEEL